MKDIRSLGFDELSEIISSYGEKTYRAAQIFEWLHRHMVESYDEMTNVNKNLRRILSDNFIIDLPQIKDVQSADDGTKKILFSLGDKECVESVCMHYEHGISVCVSTQVGCRMGCDFCASGMDGLVRNLSPAEIIGQVYAISKLINARVSHVVYMGMGEPFDNYDNVISSIRLLTDKRGQDLSARNITISTCGLVPGIVKLKDEGLPVTLALSLHNGFQEKREAIMPVARSYPLDVLIKACDDYFKTTGRRVTYEYCVIPGKNDSKEDAEVLKRLFGNKGVHINLIGVHEVTEKKQKKADKSDVLEFKNKLEKKGINVTIRRDLGAKIDGACGQLRSRKG